MSLAGLTLTYPGTVFRELKGKLLGTLEEIERELVLAHDEVIP